MNTSRHTGMGRREFLQLSSIGAIATAAAGPKLFAGEAAQPQRLAIGFVELDGGALGNAARISTGDGAFVRHGARISVTGGGTFAAPADRRAVELNAHFPYTEGNERRLAAYHAWSGSRTTGCAGKTVNFRMPVEDDKVRFTVTSQRTSGGSALTKRLGLTDGPTTQSKALPITLALGGEPGALKLARGFYVVVPLFEGDREPRWSALEVKQTNGRWAVHTRGEAAATPAEHFLLRLDYATV